MSYRVFFSVTLLSVIGISTAAFCGQEGRSVQALLARLEASTGGRLGIAAINTGTNQRIQYRANEYFPMGCTSKVIGVAAILKKSMKDNQLLSHKIQYIKADLLNWAPVTKQHLAEGMTIGELCAAAISYSDNTAMNLLTKQLGGPAGLNAFARSINDKHFKLDHWWPDEALASPASGEDTTTPAAMVESLRKLVFGEVLAPPQREMLVTWLKNNVTGDARIRAGVPKGWIVGDKTGTGFNYGTTNDIAIIWPPKCAPIVVAVYYSNNDKKAPKREDVISSATHILMDAYAQSDICIKQQYALQEQQAYKEPCNLASSYSKTSPQAVRDFRNQTQSQAKEIPHEVRRGYGAVNEPLQVVLQRFNLPGTRYHNAGMSMVTFSPGSIKSRHEHSGPEVGFVLEGELILKLEGSPPQIIHAGESFQIPTHVFHTTEAGQKGAKVIATWILTK